MAAIRASLSMRTALTHRLAVEGTRYKAGAKMVLNKGAAPLTLRRRAEWRGAPREQGRQHKGPVAAKQLHCQAAYGALKESAVPTRKSEGPKQLPPDRHHAPTPSIGSIDPRNNRRGISIELYTTASILRCVDACIWPFARLD